VHLAIETGSVAFSHICQPSDFCLALSQVISSMQVVWFFKSCGFNLTRATWPTNICYRELLKLSLRWAN